VDRYNVGPSIDGSWACKDPVPDQRETGNDNEARDHAIDKAMIERTLRRKMDDDPAAADEDQPEDDEKYPHEEDQALRHVPSALFAEAARKERGKNDVFGRSLMTDMTRTFIEQSDATVRQK
jgi:hypothetical protein